MGRYVDSFEYEGDPQVATAHGLVGDNGEGIWVEEDE